MDSMPISAHSLANEIRLKRQSFHGAFLLVEGHADAVFFKDRIAENCEIIVTRGRKKALDTVQILATNGVLGFVAVIDADYGFIFGETIDHTRVLLYDHRDLEMMLLISPAFDKVLAEYGSESKIGKLESTTGRSTLEMVIGGTRALGSLRVVSFREQLGLRFDGLRFSGFMDEKTLAIDLGKMVDTVLNHSQAHTLKRETVDRLRMELDSEGHLDVAICAGHDAIQILALGLRKAIGNQASTVSNEEAIERAFRLAYESEYFLRTALYQSIRLWESRNLPFVILA